MPQLVRDPMHQYRTCLPEDFVEVNGQRFTKVNGVIAYHSYDCGTFTKDGKTYHLVFVIQFLDELPDTGNAPSEMCDFALMFADFDQMPSFVKAVMAGTDPLVAAQALTPYAQSLIASDVAEGCDLWEIIQRRAAVLDDMYLGRTFSDALAFRPDMWQPSTDQEGNEVPNIYRCSLEYN